MANYYTKFSVVVTLPSADAANYALRLASAARRLHAATCGTIPEGWDFEVEDDSPLAPAIWVWSENGGMDTAAAFIQRLLRRFDPSGRVGFEWSNDCDKPRTDAYGGGATIITANSIDSISTWAWLEQQQKAA